MQSLNYIKNTSFNLLGNANKVLLIFFKSKYEVLQYDSNTSKTKEVHLYIEYELPVFSIAVLKAWGWDNYKYSIHARHMLGGGSLSLLYIWGNWGSPGLGDKGIKWRSLGTSWGQLDPKRSSHHASPQVI